MKQALRIGGGSLVVHIFDVAETVVGQFDGCAAPDPREVVAQASGELLSRPGCRMVLDFSRLREVADSIDSALVRLVQESQRLGRPVTLVRCGESLFRRLQRAGMRGAVTHAPSLLAATGTALGEPGKLVEMHLRSSPELLHRVRRVAAVLARQAGLSASTEHLVQTAVTEATANAIMHGSPLGPRNQVRVCFHLDGGSLVVDVTDQGPGFEPGARPSERAESGEGGLGLEMIRNSMDRVEFFRNDGGMLVRMTRFLEAGVGEGRRS